MKSVVAAVGLSVAVAGPVKFQLNPEAGRAAAIAESIVERSQSCFLNHVGDETSYKQCTMEFCGTGCGSNDNQQCQALCGKHAAALFQKFSDKYSKRKGGSDPVKRNPAAERAAAISHAVTTKSSNCFLSHVGEEDAYQKCTWAVCRNECGTNAAGCESLCGNQAATLLQKFEDQFPNPWASALVQASPIKLNPAAERAIAISHKIATSSSTCFLNHIGDDMGYHHCTEGLCFKECGGAGGNGCPELCGKQASALFQKFTQKASPDQALARQIYNDATSCFLKHIGEKAAYQTCTQDFCRKDCMKGGTGCDPVCGKQSLDLLQKLEDRFPNPYAAALLQGDPIKRNPAAERAVAIAHRIVNSATACFMGHVGESAAYKKCTAGMCYRECGSGGNGCDELCGKQVTALFQTLAQKGLKPVNSTVAIHVPRSHSFLQRSLQHAPEDELAKEMTHDLEMNFNKIAPFGKEDTAKELQDHAAKTQDTLVDAVENAEVAEIKRAVFRSLTRLRAATIKEFDTIARLETQAIDAYNDAHHYRAENPLAHLHEDEAPVETDKLKSFH